MRFRVLVHLLVYVYFSVLCRLCIVVVCVCVCVLVKWFSGAFVLWRELHHNKVSKGMEAYR